MPCPYFESLPSLTFNMTLRVYNTLSRETEEFKPVEEGVVRAYVCGLTVYDRMHIGHARTYLAFDAIFRYLRYRGYDVRYIQNVTDVDDKIIKRASEKGVEPLKLSAEYAEAALEDQRRLNLLEADAYPRVSENIEEMIDAVKTLIEKGHAYESGGDVYFEVSTFPDYGKLSNQKTDELTEHRVEQDGRKRSPLDFALWKKSGDSELGFDSPWGRGRPGWHIECSVMSRKYLGDRFDIHGGALDLIFPHHENEIAQSEALTGEKPAVKYWLHTGFLYSSGEKMSKSLGNILPVREFLEQYSAEALRMFVLQTHYRSQIDYNGGLVEEAGKAVERLRNFRAALSSAGGGGSNTAAEQMYSFKETFTEAMDDDFNTPKAVAALFEAVRDVNGMLSEQSDESVEHALQVFDEVACVLGFDFTGEELSDGLKKLIQERKRLRAEKKYVEADRIRDELLEKGIRLKDVGGRTVAERIR